MRPITELVADTEQRYAQRQPQREESKSLIAAGAVVEANTPERVQRRLERIATAEITDLSETATTGSVPLPSHRPGGAAATIPDALPATLESLNAVALERVIGASDLVGVSYLERAMAAARAVARVRIRGANGQTVGFGTGFMVSPRLLLTNIHVLGDEREASLSRAEFNFQDGLDGTPAVSHGFDLDPAAFFVTDAQLDYTLVAVKPQGSDAGDLALFGWNPLIEMEGKAIKGEALNIVQHPNGEPKQVALRENRLVDILDEFLHYETDTAPGSSGSPVFNDQWEVVALHHSGVPRRDGDGRILTRDGTPWTAAMGEQRVDWIANEGARVSRIVKHLKARRLTGAKARLRAELFEERATTPLSLGVLSPRTETDTSTGGNGMSKQRTENADTAPLHTPPEPPTGDGAAVTWTIPLHVTVRFGTPITASGGGSGSAVSGGTRSDNGVSATGDDDATAMDDEDVREALAELERGRREPYYDAAADGRAREAYYRDIDGDADDLYAPLRDLLKRTHTTPLAYKPSRHVYPVVDLRPNGRLQSIYSGREFAPEEFIRADAAIDRQRAARVRELFLREATMGSAALAEALDAVEASAPFNCEHVVPQSWFRKDEPMRGDLHHLFACEPDCNSFRSNIPYFDFTDFGERVIMEECGKRVGNRFEPVGNKGAVARATLYFILRYPGEVNRTGSEYTEERLETLLAWHAADDVSEYERHRNAAIAKKQGNRNPLIDHPDWAARIDFARGLG